MKDNCFYTYILLCSDTSYYTGITNDMERRLFEHETGTGEDTSYTHARRPLKLVYKEPFQYAEDAIKREKQIKNWSRAKKEALINGNIPRLKSLARCVNQTQHGNFEYDRGLVNQRLKTGNSS
jgi:putative endonuclease